MMNYKGRYLNNEQYLIFGSTGLRIKFYTYAILINLRFENKRKLNLRIQTTRFKFNKKFKKFLDKKLNYYKFFSNDFIDNCEK